MTAKPLTFVQDPAGLVTALVGGGDSSSPSHVVRIMRPDDLVVLEVRCFGLDLVKDDYGAALVPIREGAFLVVGFTFQHVAEQAFLDASLVTTETPHSPVSVLVAEPSRLAFAVGPGERIPYTSAGILEALSRLPLRVAPLAAPRVLPALAPQLPPIVSLPGGLVLAHSSSVGGLVLSHAAAGPPAPLAVPTDALVAHAQAMRVARSLLAEAGAIDLVDVSEGTSQPLAAGEQVTASTGLAAARRSLGDVLVRPTPAGPPPTQQPRPPRPDETAIEAPWRVLLSPSVQGGFAHAVTPAAAPGDADRIELWHSRLAVRQVADDGSVTIVEQDNAQRVVRAIWARDRGGAQPAASNDVTPFRTSLTATHRVALVIESADPTIAVPQPIDAERLYLSSQGAWLDLHGQWDDRPYTQAGVSAIDSWDHLAPMGRDQHVKVTTPAHYHILGHRCSLVTVTERRIDPGGEPIAYLHQRRFIKLREPIRFYNDPTMPFVRVELRPAITPFLDPVTPGTSNVISGEDLFWPTVGGVKFEYTWDCLDRDGRRVLLQAPLLFVSAALGSDPAEADKIRSAYITPDSGSPAPRGIPALSQSIALAPSARSGDTAFEVDTLRFTGDPVPGADPTSTPHLSGAALVVPAMKRLSPQAGPVDVHYATPYLQHGFAGPNVDPQVFLELETMSPISFAGSAGGSTEKSGGFLQPDLPVRGLSRVLGTVGQVDSLVNPLPSTKPFDPATFLDGVLPRLFGLFSLVDILDAAGLEKAPKFVTETLDEVAGLLSALQALQRVFTDGLAELDHIAAGAPTAPLRQSAAAAKTALAAIETAFSPAFTQLTTGVTALKASGDVGTFQADATVALSGLATAIDALTTTLPTLSLPPVLKARLQRLIGALAPIRVLLADAAQLVKQISDIVDFVKGLDPSSLSIKASFDWSPKLQNFPKDAPNDDALFFVDENGLLLSIEVRAAGTGTVGVDVLAQLSNFGLNLFEKKSSTLIRIAIDRLSFRASSGGKPEVDVVMNDMAWQGVLAFIEVLETLIPSDGFSDPPFVDVSSSGVKAGFDLALPNVAIGVFSLENVSLGADVNVPFLGDAVTVGFSFCSRDKPFRLTVLCVGGGGFVGVRLSPKGLVLLEMELEACAQLAIDLGVASGSVSIAVGIYLRLEGHDGSLTGYFRIRGQVDVLGLISASITLELSLTYDFGSGKMIGRASVSVEVSIFMFSVSVSVSCERRLAGSNADPTFAEILGIIDNGTVVPNPGAPDGGVPAWTDYCAAFAEV